MWGWMRLGSSSFGAVQLMGWRSESEGGKETKVG